MPYKIPISAPNLTDLERKYLNQAFDSGWVSSKGYFVEKFEEKFAEWLGINYAITTSSGTTALHLAVLSLDPIPGDWFYVTPNAYRACENVVKMVQGKLVDDTQQHSIIVHNYGHVNPWGLESFSNLIEDCAEALGSKYGEKKVGTFGALSVFSFYANKTITTGEGGMVCTNRRDLALKIRHLRNQAMIEPYIHDQVGYNYRMTNLQAALGLAQLERIEELIEKKLQITAWYAKYLNSERLLPLTAVKGSEPVIWMNVFLVENQGRFRNYMDFQGIETRPGFNPAQNLVMLPSGTTLTEEEVKEVSEIANAYSRPV